MSLTLDGGGFSIDGRWLCAAPACASQPGRLVRAARAERIGQEHAAAPARRRLGADRRHGRARWRAAAARAAAGAGAGRRAGAAGHPHRLRLHGARDRGDGPPRPPRAVPARGAPPTARRSRSRWRGPTSPPSPIATPPGCPAASGSGCSSRGAWPPRRATSCSTSRPPASTSRTRWTCSRCAAVSPTTATPSRWRCTT